MTKNVIVFKYLSHTEKGLRYILLDGLVKVNKKNVNSVIIYSPSSCFSSVE